MIIFDIVGEPIPQGSKTATVINGRAVMFDSNKKLKAWRSQVTATALKHRLASDHDTFGPQVPVGVVLLFRLAKPKSVTREFPAVKPDLDKLVRSVMDGLTDAGIWADDSQVISIHASKKYCNDSDTMGVSVNVFAKLPSKDIN